MQYAHNRNAFRYDAKIDDVAADRAPPVSLSDMIAGRRTMGRGSELGTCGFDEIDIAQGLAPPPMRESVIKNPVKVALCGWSELEASHALRACGA